MEQQRMNANKELGEMTQRENISTDKVDLRLYRLFGEGYDVNDQGEPNAPIDEFKKMRHETFKEDYLSGDIERRAPYIQKFCDEIMAFPVTNELFDEKYIMTHIREIKTICDRACYFQNIQDIDTRNKEFFEGMSPEEKRALSEKLDFLASYGCYFQGFIGRLGVDSNTGMYKDPDELDTGYDARSEKDFKGIAQRRLNILKVANAGDENERLGRELITKKLREYFPKASDNEIQGRMGNMYYRYGMLMRPGDFGNRNSDIAELAVKSYRMNGTNDSGERAELEKEQARLAAKVVNEYMDTYSKKIEGQIPKYVSMSDQDLMNHYEELAEYGRSLEQVSYGRSLEQVSPWKPKTAIYGSSWSRMSNIGNIKANPGTDDGMTVEQKYANTHEGFDLRSYSVGNNIMGSLAKKARFLIYKDAVINRIDPMSDALGPLLDGTDGRSYIDSIDWQEIGPELKRRAYTEERYDDSLGTVTIKTGVYDELLSRLDQIIEAETQYVNESYQAFRQEQERMQQNKK
jgi:hypothetical protein